MSELCHRVHRILILSIWGANVVVVNCEEGADNKHGVGEIMPSIFPITVHTIRWVEAEREEVLLSGRRVDDMKGRTVRNCENMLLAFGGGPRVCLGQVSV